MMTGHSFSALILDDDVACGESLRDMLDRTHFQPTYFSHPEAGIIHASTHPFDIAFIDLRMPEIDGIMALQKLKEHAPQLICIMMSGFATIDAAVEAMRLGAYDFLLKPIRKNYLNHILDKVGEKLTLSAEIQALREQIEEQNTPLIGQSPAVMALKRLIKRVAKSSASVLVLGESGTGKELVVDMIHAQSPRKQQPLVKLNCAAIPSNLVESELFGFVKGAFTGAIQDKTGRFEQADGGTLFLDEIGELPLETQVKILRVLQEKTLTRIGSNQEKKVDVRIICATNQDLQKLIADGRFREDLFFRINVVPIHVPPVRDRIEDIPVLMRFFIDRACKTHHKSEKGFTRKALSLAVQYAWPGNVRELQHLCESLAITTDSQWISETDLPETLYKREPEHPQPTIDVPYGTPLHIATDHIIQKTLIACGGDVERAAQLLQVHPRTIKRHLEAAYPR